MSDPPIFTVLGIGAGVGVCLSLALAANGEGSFIESALSVIFSLPIFVPGGMLAAGIFAAPIVTGIVLPPLILQAIVEAFINE